MSDFGHGRTVQRVPYVRTDRADGQVIVRGDPVDVWASGYDPDPTPREGASRSGILFVDPDVTVHPLDEWIVDGDRYTVSHMDRIRSDFTRKDFDTEIAVRIDLTLDELRAAAESGMVTPCTIERKTGTGTDPANYQRIDTWADVWAGRCKVETTQTHRETTVGGQSVTEQPVTVSVPWDAPMAQQGDRIVTDLGIFHVAGIIRDSRRIQQEYACSENQEVVGA